MTDLGGGCALWVDEEVDDDSLVGPTEAQDWPLLSDLLKQDLVAWNAAALASYSLSGATGQRTWAELVAAGKALTSRVQEELGPNYLVEWSQ